MIQRRMNDERGLRRPNDGILMYGKERDIALENTLLNAL